MQVVCFCLEYPLENAFFSSSHTFPHQPGFLLSLGWALSSSQSWILTVIPLLTSQAATARAAQPRKCQHRDVSNRLMPITLTPTLPRTASSSCSTQPTGTHTDPILLPQKLPQAAALTPAHESSSGKMIFSMSHPLLHLEDKMKQPSKCFYWNNSSHLTDWTEKNCNEGRVVFLTFSEDNLEEG